MTERYSFSLTTFSPSGKLVQIEYALNAVAAGASSVGVKSVGGVVLAAEDKSSPLVTPGFIKKVEQISPHIAMTYSGLGPDFRLLVNSARKKAEQHRLMYGCEITTKQLVQKVASIMQEHTQSGGVRPFGVSLLIGGWDADENCASLYQCDPSGAFYPWKATALGKNFINSRTFLEKRYNDELDLDDAIHTALLTLKESFDVEMNAQNVQVCICKPDGVHLLAVDAVRDHIASL